MESRVSFGYWVRRQRKALDLTQQVLADHVGCSAAAIKKIESDERRPSRQIAERLADMLDVPADQRKVFLEVARGVRPVDQLLLAHESASHTHKEISYLPSGTVTFLFTDIEGSTLFSQLRPDAMKHALARHHALLRSAIESNSGHVFQIVGDSFSASFDNALNALNAALNAQRRLRDEPWGETEPIRVRMGLHTGVVNLTEGSMEMPYSGYSTIAFTQRIMSAAFGGQILLSGVTRELLEGLLLPDVTLRDMGEHRLKDLLRPMHLYQVTTADLPADFPPLKTLNSFPHNLPIQLTSFIGRESELAEVKQLLTNTRLLTLTGPGGTGKTRLALQIAEELLPSFADGVWLAELAPLTDASFISRTIAGIFGLRELPNMPIINTVTDFLRPKQLLLILDNCEHLIEACAKLSDHLLHACPQLKIIASSREALGIAGETAYRVPSLSLPDQGHVTRETVLGFESVQLFVERVSAANPKFHLTDENASDIAQICCRLDGIPLALELAAARIRVFSTEEIAARLDDRFRLLTGGSRTALERHQTLRALIDWSYDLLSRDERWLFRQLSVFAGGWTFEAAEAVCSAPLSQPRRGVRGEGLDVLILLPQLVNKSLVIVDEEAEGTRYHLLETIRQYARDKLLEADESNKVRDRHLDFFLKFAEEAEPKVFSNMSGIWWRLDKDLNNFRAAMEWSTRSGKAVAALQIAGSLIYFWFARGLVGSEWYDRVQPALVHPEGMKRTRARAKVLNGIGLLYWADIHPTVTRSALEEALSIGRELGSSWDIATALRNLGLHASIAGNYEEAQTLLEQSLQIWQEMGPEGRLGSSWTLIFLGETALRQEQSERARLLFEKANTILMEIGDHNFLAYSLRRLAQLAWCEGNYEKATALCQESLIFNREVDDLRGVIACLAGFADIATGQGKLERAARLMATVENQLVSINTRLLILDKMEYERNLALLRATMDEATFTKAWAEGRALTMEHAIEYALSEMAE